MTFIPAVPLGGVAGYRFLQDTGDQQREAMVESPQIKRELDYFKENIGSVDSVDELLADRRLLEIAMTAYGLETEVDKTTLVRQVLESDVSDSASFANRLNDRRWSDFARDFGFADPNAGRAQTSLQIAVNFRVEGATPEFQASDAPKIDAFALEHFRREAPQLTSIDDLLADSLTLDVALQAFDIDRTFYSDAAIRDFIENGVDTSAGSSEFQSSFGGELTKWASFADAFAGLSSTGTVSQVSRFGLEVEKAIEANGVSMASEADAASDPTQISRANVVDFLAAVDGFTSAQDLVNDANALKVVKVAFGLGDEAITDEAFVALLEDGAEGVAQTRGDFGWIQLAGAFERNFSGGAQTLMPDYERDVELRIAQDSLEALPTDPQPPEPPQIDADDLAYFNAAIGSIDSAEQLVSDQRLLSVAMTAFGLENETRSDAFLTDILSEDPYDDSSFVNQLSDTRWRDLARAFIPPSDGSGLGRDVIQFELESRLKEIEAPQEDIDYLRRNINLVDEPLDLVFDPQLMDIALSAFGLEKNTFTNTFVINALIADPSEPNSFVNQLNDPRWVAFAETFGAGGGAGNVGLESFQASVLEKYEARRFELSVGEFDNDLRLALNFQRAIGDIAGRADVSEVGWLQLLGDLALREVTDAGFGLPTEFAQLGIDSQIEELESRSLALFGVADPSAFLEPSNVDTLVSRFLSLSGQNTNPAADPAVSLMSGSVTLARSVVDTRV